MARSAEEIGTFCEHNGVQLYPAWAKFYHGVAAAQDGDPPSFCLPPVDFCSGVSPSQASKSRPAGNPSAAGTNAVIAVEVISPTPGIVINRRAVGSDFERWLSPCSDSP